MPYYGMESSFSVKLDYLSTNTVEWSFLPVSTLTGCNYHKTLSLNNIAPGYECRRSSGHSLKPTYCQRYLQWPSMAELGCLLMIVQSHLPPLSKWSSTCVYVTRPSQYWEICWYTGRNTAIKMTITICLKNGSTHLTLIFYVITMIKYPTIFMQGVTIVQKLNGPAR